MAAQVNPVQMMAGSPFQDAAAALDFGFVPTGRETPEELIQ